MIGLVACRARRRRSQSLRLTTWNTTVLTQPVFFMAIRFGVYLIRMLYSSQPRSDPVHESWRQFTQPYVELFSLRLTAQQFGYLCFGCLATLLVWSIFGGAITRIAALQLAREERISLVKALRFSLGKTLSYFASPLMPLLALAAFSAGVFVIVGLPMNSDAGLIWSGLVWVFVLGLGVLVGVLLLGLLFGWPLMWATISTEGTDTFDALSRTYAYTFSGRCIICCTRCWPVF